MRTCSSCGRENPDDARFCASCGSELTGGGRVREQLKVVRETERLLAPPA